MFDLEEIAVGLHGCGQPIRLRALIMLETEHSPSELWAMLNGPSLGVVSYHMRMLRDYGLIIETRTEQRRGALEHFYIRTPLAEELVRMLAPVLGLPRKTRRRGEAREHELLRALGVETEALAA
jgi:hypothetical protein